ncbi:hypothetical protein BGX26_011452 [Mortierella sp. AD094]|nr:hypothetical protein BGX26_011452 [Mortierella sp. AD094]
MGMKVLRTKEHDDKTEHVQSIGEEGKLPSCDRDEFSSGYVNMVGIGSPVNPERYPELSDKRSHIRIIIGNNKETLCATTIPDNKICWSIQVQISKSKAKELQFRNSGWGPEAIDTTLKEFESFPWVFGGTMKEIFDVTPKDLISKVFLEEKVFQTWHHRRSVLIGDACHKILPGAGQGAVMAMKDAVVLANCLYNMKDQSLKSIKTAFKSYYRQRFPEAEIQLNNSANFSKLLFGQTLDQSEKSNLKK